MTETFHAIRCKCDGYSFDSKSEMRRYQELKLLQLAGLIDKLEVHPKLYIIPAYNDNRRVDYTADFAYWDCEAKVQTVEDVKPWRRNAKGERVPYLTREFILKWKLVQYWHTTMWFRIVEA